MLKCCMLGLLPLFFYGCKHQGTAHAAFYSWKTIFHLDQKEAHLLYTAADNHLYLRFFDVVWNAEQQQALPNGVLSVKSPLKKLAITPVIYITNQSLENSSLLQMDSLAFKVNQLLNRLADRQGISYTNCQLDCDWTVGTKTKYFAFLRFFKQYNGKRLEATIRLHQVKYPERTGMPPVDKGLLMFYNMGKISADLNAENSIYNQNDAAAYLAALPKYHLPLDVALPLFSWAIQIRLGKVVQVYAKITLAELSDKQLFAPVTKASSLVPTRISALPNAGRPLPVYRALKSFYLKGVYVKKNDLFKFEGVDKELLTQAAKQVSEYLAPLENRNIIYYELSSINLLPLYEKDIKEISAYF